EYPKNIINNRLRKTTTANNLIEVSHTKGIVVIPSRITTDRPIKFNYINQRIYEVFILRMLSEVVTSQAVQNLKIRQSINNQRTDYNIGILLDFSDFYLWLLKSIFLLL